MLFIWTRLHKTWSLRGRKCIRYIQVSSLGFISPLSCYNIAGCPFVAMSKAFMLKLCTPIGSIQIKSVHIFNLLCVLIIVCKTYAILLWVWPFCLILAKDYKEHLRWNALCNHNTRTTLTLKPNNIPGNGKVSQITKSTLTHKKNFLDVEVKSRTSACSVTYATKAWDTESAWSCQS